MRNIMQKDRMKEGRRRREKKRKSENHLREKESGK